MMRDTGEYICRSSGINPMLVARGADFGSIAAGSGITSPASTFSQITSAGAASQQADTQASQSPSVIDLNTSSASAARASAGLQTATVDKVLAETSNVQSDTDRLKALVQNLEQERQNLIKAGYNLTETGNVLRATFDKLKAEVPWLQSQTGLNAVRDELLRLDVDAAKQFENFGREFKQYEPIVKLLIHLFRPYGGHQ